MLDCSREGNSRSLSPTKERLFPESLPFIFVSRGTEQRFDMSDDVEKIQLDLNRPTTRLSSSNLHLSRSRRVEGGATSVISESFACTFLAILAVKGVLNWTCQ